MPYCQFVSSARFFLKLKSVISTPGTVKAFLSITYLHILWIHDPVGCLKE